VRLDLATTAAAMGGRMLGAEPADGWSGVSWNGATFDSRQVAGGELFFALPGEQTDGHRFVAAALGNGAAAAVVHESCEAPDGGALIRVDDVFTALHALTRHLLAAGEPGSIVAVTGSAGKTTTKELLAAMLGSRYRVARNEGNLNNTYGFPLSVLRLPAGVEWMVAEMGMSTPGELETLSRLSRPRAVVFTCVRPAHLEFFADGLAGIAAAKAELLTGLVPGGLVVANADDPEIVRFVGRYAADHPEARVVWFGRGESADVTAREVEVEEGGSRFTLVAGPGVAADGEPVERPVRLTLHGGYNVDNALAAAAAALALGASADEVAAGMAGAAPAAGRGVVHRLPGDRVLIDDSYNSNPDALSRALAAAAALARAGGARRRWAVLGDMLELGPEAPRFHGEAGAEAARLGFSPVAGVGELSRALVEAAGEADEVEAIWFEDAAAAAGWAAGELADGDLVLVKGSRGVRLDRVVERLSGEAA